ncbi:MAG TPA: hypothetical protein VFA18_25590 [Gemmataceae bacterium]|nr:hypothetical protein [Gemmataceae bacterium]
MAAGNSASWPRPQRRAPARAVARHSTITLAMHRYSHLVLYYQTDALAKLPELPAALSRAAKVVAATGTTGPVPHRKACARVALDCSASDNG